MSPQEPDLEDKELGDRYRRAADAAAASPSDATRAAILAEGRRLAETFKPTPLTAFDTRQPAANQPRWRLAAFGTVGIALLATVLMLPYFHEAPPPTAARAALDRAESVTAPLSAAQPPAPAPETPLQEIIVTQQTRSRKPSAAPFSAKNSSAAAKADAPAASPKPADVLSSTARRLDTPSAPAERAPAAAAPSYAAAPRAEALAKRAQSADANLGVEASRAQPASIVAAVSAGDISRVAQLLDQGVGTEQPDAAGGTALLQAVTMGRADMVRLLLARGADPNAADTSGQKPLQRAQQLHHVEIEAVLEAAGGR